MTDGDSKFESLPEEAMIRINRLCNDFEQGWRQGESPVIEEVLAEIEPALRPSLLLELLPLEIAYRRRHEMTVPVEQYLRRFPVVSLTSLSALMNDTQEGQAAETANSVEHANHEIPAHEIPARLGDYRIVRRIGSGGMGTVYEACHERMGRTVAIKVLRPELAARTEVMERFTREIRAAARLSHPNIVVAYDSREENGSAYLVTEFVNGTDLRQLVKQQGPLPISEVVEMVIQAATGLQYAHEEGVVHRDIKPSNLMRVHPNPPSADGLAQSEKPVVVKVLDLGLARLGAADDSELTSSNTVMGTAAYMAPEQAMCPKEVDHRADIYSLGCTLYYLLTSQPVYSGDTVFETALAHTNRPVPSLSELRPDLASALDPILQRMLAKQPSDRYPSMAEVIPELEQAAELLDSDYHGSPPASSTPRHTVTSRTTNVHVARWHSELVPVALLALFTVCVIGVAFWMTRLQNRGGIPEDPSANILPVERTPAALPPSPESVSDRWALSFNGKTSGAEAASPGIPREQFTIEAIVTVYEPHISVVTAWYHGQWSVGIGVNLEGGWGIGYHRRNPRARQYYQPVYLHAAGPVLRRQRVHLAAVFDGDTARLFVDGTELELEVDGGAPTSDLKGIYIGRYAPPELLNDPIHPDRFFNGLIHAVRFSNGARYTEDFAPPAALTGVSGDDSILVFNFEEGAGNESHDVLGRGTAKLTDVEWVQP